MASPFICQSTFLYFVVFPSFSLFWSFIFVLHSKLLPSFWSTLAKHISFSIINISQIIFMPANICTVCNLHMLNDNKSYLPSSRWNLRFTSFPSPAGMALTKLPLDRNNSVMTSLFPPKESLVVTSRLWTGNSRTFFYGVGAADKAVLNKVHGKKPIWYVSLDVCPIHTQLLQENGPLNRRKMPRPSIKHNQGFQIAKQLIAIVTLVEGPWHGSTKTIGPLPWTVRSWDRKR